MFFQEKYERARRIQKERRGLSENEENMEYHGEKLYEPTIKDLMEKGDMVSLMVSGVLTILPIAFIALVIIVVVAFLFFRIF